MLCKFTIYLKADYEVHLTQIISFHHFLYPYDDNFIEFRIGIIIFTFYAFSDHNLLNLLS